MTEEEELYCICQERYDKDKLMFQCDKCKKWVHPVCCNDSQEIIDKHLGDKDLEYLCVFCRDNKDCKEIEPKGAAKRVINDNDSQSLTGSASKRPKHNPEDN